MIDKSTWDKVKLGDVVRNVKDKVDINTCKLEYYLGGEHFDTDSLHVNGKGVIAESTIGPAFIMRFKPGQVMLVSRNPHLRKMAVADFEGICSNVTYVCETKSDDLLQKFLPFIMRSQDFWSFAEANKRGSTNFYLNWTDFAQYEFRLPPIEEQKRIAELLWAADEVAYKERDVLEAINQVEAICQGEIFSGRFPATTIGDEFEVQLGKMLSPKSKAENSKGELPYLGNFNVQWNRFALDNVNTMLFSEKEQAKFELWNGDLLVCEGGEVGRCAIWNGEIKPCYYQKALHRLRAKKGYSPYLLMQYMIWASGNGLLKKLTGHSTIAHLPAEKLRQVQIPRLNKAEILKYESLFNQIDGVRYKCIANIEGKKDVLGNMVSYYIGGAN